MNRVAHGLVAAMLAALAALPSHAAKPGGGAMRQLLDSAKLHLSTGDFEAAEAEARSALELVRSKGGEADVRAAGPMTVLGNVLAAQGRYAEAEALQREALALRQRELGPEAEATEASMFSLATTLRQSGNFAEAEALLRRCLELRQRISGPESPDTARRLNHLAGLLSDQARFEEAEKLVRQSLAAVEEAWVGRDNRVSARALLLLSRIASQQDRDEEAVSLARRAVAMHHSVFGADSARTADALARLGNALDKAGRRDEAEQVLREALSIAESRLGPAHPATARTRFHLGQVLAHRGKRAEAEAMLRSALQASRGITPPLRYAEMSRVLGVFLARAGRPAEAVGYYRDAVETLDRLYALTRGQEEEARQSFAGRYAHFYRELIELLLELDAAQPAGEWGREALAVASRGQSRIFTELMRQADVSRFSGDPAFLQLKSAREAVLQRAAALQAALAALPEDDDDGEAAPGERRARLRSRLQAADAELARTDDALWRDYPRYMELANPRPVSVEELQQKLLRPGEALVSFAMLERETALFALTRERFVLARAPAGRTDLEARVRAARAPIEKVAGGAPITALRGLDPAALHELYRLLLAPLEPVLAGARQVLVVADGALATLPLELLASRFDAGAFAAAREAADGSPDHPLLGEYALPEYLGARHRFAYLPSLAALASQRLHPKPARAFGAELAAFGDPVFRPEAGAAYGAQTRSALETLSRSVRGRDAVLEIPRLPDTADEVRTVAGLLPGEKRLYLRDAAQERTAKGGALRDARYVLLATHGFLGGEFLGAGLPAQPALALTLAGDLGGEDGFLTMKEVLEELDLGAELVALSACNTAGAGERAAQGEGFAGLTRAFMYAGARGLLVSHWSVETQATRELVTAVFGALREGTPPVEALSRAQAAVRASQFGPDDLRVSRSHPFFWAPFVYVGD